MASKALHWEFQYNYVDFENILEILLTLIKQNVFDPKHLEGASSDLVRSMFKVGRKAAELEREKLQTEIQKERGEIRRKQLENRLKMSGKAGGKGGPAQNLKKTTQEPDDDDDDFLDDLVVDTETAKQPSYSTLKPGGFMTKAEDRKGRLEKRRAKRKDNDEADDDEKQETEQEKLEREAGELKSQLKNVERAEAQARDKDQKDKAKHYSQRIEWKVPEATKSRDVSRAEETEKVDEDGRHS